MNRSFLNVMLLLVTLILVAGCSKPGAKLVATSGTLTVGGQPAEGVEIVFSPKMEDNGPANIGPPSFGVTDASGKFTLKTLRAGEGAVPGTHKVIFQYPDMEDGAMEELQEELNDTKESEEDTADVKARINDLKSKMKNRVKIPGGTVLEVTIPPGGASDLKVDVPVG